MTPAKRMLDLILFAAILILTWPLIILVALWILLRDGRPVFYVSERVHAPGVAGRAPRSQRYSVPYVDPSTRM